MTARTSLHKCNKMFLTKEHIAKWFLILLCLFQCCFTEDPGELLDELTTTEAIQSLTDPLLISLQEDATESSIHSHTEAAISGEESEFDVDEPTTTLEPPEFSRSDDPPSQPNPENETPSVANSKLFLRRFGEPVDARGDRNFGANLSPSSADNVASGDHPLNIEDFSLTELDSWRPVWPFSGPLSNKPSNVPTRPTIRPVKQSPIFTVEKEPVTAYYFDLTTPSIQPAPGPLYDPTKLLSSINPSLTTPNHHNQTANTAPLSIPTLNTNSQALPTLITHAISSIPTLTIIPLSETTVNHSDMPLENTEDRNSEDYDTPADESTGVNATHPHKGEPLDINSTSTDTLDPSQLRNSTIKSTTLRKVNNRVPLWKRLSHKISPTLDLSSMPTTVLLSSPTLVPVFSSSIEDDLPLGILSAGLPVIPELSPSFTIHGTESTDFIDPSISLETPHFSLLSTIIAPIDPSSTLKNVEDKTHVPNNLFKGPLTGRGQSQDPVVNINSIPEPKIKIRIPMITTPLQSETSTISTLQESWKPLVNDSLDSSTKLPEKSSTYSSQIVSSPTYHLQSNFTPISPSTSVASSNFETLIQPTKTLPQPSFSRPPINSTLYIAEKGVQVDLLEETPKESNITASKDKPFDNSTAILNLSEAPLSHVDYFDTNDVFVPITEKEESFNFGLDIDSNLTDTIVDHFGNFTENSTISEVSIDTTTPARDLTTKKEENEERFAFSLPKATSTITTSSTTTTEPSTSATSSTTLTTTTTTTTTITTPSTTSSTTTKTTTTTPVETSTTTSSTTTEEKKTITFNTTTADFDTNEILETSTNSSEETEIDGKIITHFEKPSGAEAKLNIVEMHENGTNSTMEAPFIKAAVSYDILEFCRHRKNIRNLLAEWLQKHLQGTEADPETYEVEIFHQPNCDAITTYNADIESMKENQTDVYFFVKKDGEISPNITLGYPKDISSYEITQELEYLKEKIVHLELVNTLSTENRILEDAVGTSIIVIAIVSVILVLAIVAAVFAIIIVKRRRAAEAMHGRCRPAANDAYSMDSVSVFYHSFKRNRKRVSNKSLRSYLNQGFDDPNGPSRPLNFAKLTHFIADNEGIHKEFENIPSVFPNYDEMPRGCEDKNRYANVIPVPETRVLLKAANKHRPCAEYINANSVHGPRGEQRYYIATQAPLDETVRDFWQMIWEQESRVIVMLTDFVEKGIDKCADYLPPSETLDCHRVYGDFQITLKSRDMRDKYIASQIQLKNLENNLTREICHMWYTGWPYSGVPNEEAPFISFIFDVRMTRKRLRSKGPIIVHCSPGTGRTGTYIACDTAMKHFEDQKTIDIPKTVYKVRRERAGSVQTKEQYAFIYRVVNLYAAKLTTGNLDSF